MENIRHQSGSMPQNMPESTTNINVKRWGFISSTLISLFTNICNSSYMGSNSSVMGRHQNVQKILTSLLFHKTKKVTTFNCFFCVYYDIYFFLVLSFKNSGQNWESNWRPTVCYTLTCSFVFFQTTNSLIWVFM